MVESLHISYRSSQLMFAKIFFLFNLALLAVFIWRGFELHFLNSDSAGTVLLTKEIIDSGQFFPRDWTYGNGDLFLLLEHKILIPIFKFFPMRHFQKISGTVSAFLLLLGIWLISGLTHANLTQRLITIAVFASTISTGMAETLFGPYIYGSIVYLNCFILYFSLKILEGEKNKSKIYYGFLLLSILILICWQNVQRAIIFCLLPLFFVSMSYKWRADNSLKPYFIIKNKLTLFSFIILGFLIGAYLNYSTRKVVNMDAGALNLHWISYNAMLKKITQIIPAALLNLFEGLPPAGGKIEALTAVYYVLRCMATVAFFMLIPISLYKVYIDKTNKKSQLWFLSAFALSSFLIILFFQIVTDVVAIDRYLAPAISLFFVLVLTSDFKFKRAPFLYCSKLLVTTVFLVNSWNALYTVKIIGTEEERNEKLKNYNVDAHVRIKNFLIQHGLRYGYASYWNAGVISALSNEQVCVRQVHFSGGILIPMHWISAAHWYSPKFYEGKTFILLTLDELKSIDWNHLKLYDLEPLQILEFENYKIFIFEENIAKKLPAWDSSYNAKSTFFASHLSSQVGQFVEKFDENGPAMISLKGESGFLHYGPYAKVEPGDYTVTFNILAKASGLAVFKLDVISAPPNATLLVEKTFYGAENIQKFSIHVDKAQILEFRVFTFGNEKVVFRDVSIERDLLVTLK